jgi:hypothetical protein
MEFPCGELFPGVGFIVTRFQTSNRAVVRFMTTVGRHSRLKVVDDASDAKAVSIALMGKVAARLLRHPYWKEPTLPGQLDLLRMVVVFFKKEPLIMLFTEANGIAELQPPVK